MLDEKNFIFYDTETTGTNIDFDQIIQFAAILTDCNFNELDRINVRCRRLPWVVPSPGAMVITGVTPGQIDDENLQLFPEMMETIRDKLESWSPAIFIGYNSFQFDEPFLQRAFWQTLNPPYLTVTNGNARGDILPLVRAVSRVTPHALSIPNISSGRPVFRLDRLAPLNGFSHANAHDAQGDVLAVIHISKRIASRAPALWTSLLNGADRKLVSNLMQAAEPIFFAEPLKGGRPGWWGIPIGSDTYQRSTKLVAKLTADWKDFFTKENSVQGALIATPAFQMRRIKENMFPVAFSQSDAKELLGITPSKREIEEAEFLGFPERKRHLESLAAQANVPRAEPKALEQRIFEGFPSENDEKVIKKFSSLPWHQRASLTRELEDPRLQQIAQRLIFLMAPNTLSEVDQDRVWQGIKDRLLDTHSDKTLWRTIDLAEQELNDLRKSSHSEHTIQAIENWYLEMRNSL